MQYTRPSFSAAVSNGSISDTAYEVAVGARCGTCLRRTERRAEVTSSTHWGNFRDVLVIPSECTCPND